MTQLLGIGPYIVFVSNIANIGLIISSSNLIRLFQAITDMFYGKLNSIDHILYHTPSFSYWNEANKLENIITLVFVWN